MNQTAASDTNPFRQEIDALRRVVERHVRWHDQALDFLRQVIDGRGTEDEWPALADFLERSDTRIVESVATKEEILQHERDRWAARYEHASKLLTDILFHLPPQAIKLEDGRVMVFKDPDPARTLDLIQHALQRAFDAARASDTSTEQRS